MARQGSRNRVRVGEAASRVLGHLRRIIHAIHRQSAAIEASTGLTGPQLWALREIALSDEGVTLGDLARRLALHKANAGRLVDRLASRRLVTRGSVPGDGRSVLVRATSKGRRQAVAPVGGPLQADLLARLGDLPPAQVERIDRALVRLVLLVGAEGVEPLPLFDGERPERAASRPRVRPDAPVPPRGRPSRGRGRAA